MDALGIDISVWQDNNSTPQMFDPNKARSKGASFVGIKVSQANWADPDYALNWAHCKNVLYRMPYHFLTWDISPRRQAEVFWSLIERDTYALLPLVCDFEWWHPVSSRAMDILYNFTVRLKQLCSPLPQGIYTARQFWIESGSPAEYWKQFYLWLCDISGPVEVPQPWDTWTFHQYTFKLNGPEWGAESLDLDGDRYNGTLADMIARFSLPDLGWPDLEPEPEPEPDPEPQPEPAGPGLRMRVLIDGLNVRTGPGTNFPVVGRLSKDECVDVLAVGGINAWVKIAIDPDRWACVQISSTRFMTEA